MLAAGGKADLSAAYLSAAGLKALGESVPSDVCAYAAKFDANDLESIFEATRLKDAGCSVRPMTPDALALSQSAPPPSTHRASSPLVSPLPDQGSQAAGKATVEAVLKSETRDAWKLAQAVLSADVVGAALNKDDVVKKFTAILAADYTVRGAGLMLTAVSKMGLPADKLTAFVDVVEDLVGQAEVTGDMLAVRCRPSAGAGASFLFLFLFLFLFHLNPYPPSLPPPLPPTLPSSTAASLRLPP